jgi:hypothetical protein
MALVSYAEIQAEIARELWDRDDLTNDIINAITLCEAQLNNVVTTAQMETSASITLTSGSGSLPTDYLQYRRVVTQDSPARALVWAEPEWAATNYDGAAAASLSDYFTILGSTIKTYPTSSSNLTMQYYQKVPALASNSAGNWITSRDPGLYIYGALVHLAAKLDDDQRIATWGTLYNSSVTNLLRRDTLGRYAKPVMRVKGYLP